MQYLEDDTLVEVMYNAVLDYLNNQQRSQQKRRYTADQNDQNKDQNDPSDEPKVQESSTPFPQQSPTFHYRDHR